MASHQRSLKQQTLWLGRSILKKAAPRFELGIKDLQSSALPLGHAAAGERLLPQSDRISHGSTTLLVVCNGHGEDLIALRILEAVHRRNPQLPLEVMPLVGKGRAFEPAVKAGWLQQIGPTANLPSGGFSNQSLRGMLRDIGAGLPLLSWSQWRLVQRRARQGCFFVAIGDLLPLLMAWASGAGFGFIGTPKSDYTWRSGPGRDLSDRYHRLKGSEWDPWEWMLMRSKRCQWVAMRDQLTARGLRRHRVAAKALGNPMMDGIQRRTIPKALERCRRVLVLCGSRMPEAQANFDRLLNAIRLVQSPVPMGVLVAAGAEPTTEGFQRSLEQQGFRHSASTQHKHSSAPLECFRNRLALEAIHHWITGRFSSHPMATQSSGCELVSHRDPLAPFGAHQDPFPGIPFTALQAVISIAQVSARTASPGVITFWRPNESEASATGPGHQQRQ